MSELLFCPFLNPSECEWICELRQKARTNNIVSMDNTKCIECQHNSITDCTGIHCEIFKCFIGDLDFFCAWGVKRDTQE